MLLSCDRDWVDGGEDGEVIVPVLVGMRRGTFGSCEDSK